MNIEGLVRGKTGSSANMVVSHSSQAPAENNRNCQKECDCKTRRRVVVKTARRRTRYLIYAATTMQGRKRMIVESPAGHCSSGLRPAPRPHRKSRWDGQENAAGCHFEPLEPQFNWLERRSPKFLGPPVTFSASSACLLQCFLLGLPQMLNPSSVGD
jgi:hypothetical protein